MIRSLALGATSSSTVPKAPPFMIRKAIAATAGSVIVLPVAVTIINLPVSWLSRVLSTAVDSAVNDPRFPAVTPKELDSIIVDLSVLTPPKKIEYSKPEELLDIVKVGRDGLIAVRGMFRGLLLPQVAVDWKWNTQEFLEHTCNKAGLSVDMWKDPETEFMSFQAEIFGEEQPRGNILRNPKHPRCD